MKTWSITEARANIANVFDEALESGPQKIERRDGRSVVMIAESDWKRLALAYPTMADLILNSGIEPEDLPQRRPARVITKDFF